MYAVGGSLLEIEMWTEARNHHVGDVDGQGHFIVVFYIVCGLFHQVL